MLFYPGKCNKEVYLFAQSRDPPDIYTFPYRNELLVLCMFICYYPVWFPHRIFEEYLYLTRDYRSSHKLSYFSNAFFGLREFEIIVAVKECLYKPVDARIGCHEHVKVQGTQCKPSEHIEFMFDDPFIVLPQISHDPVTLCIG